MCLKIHSNFQHFAVVDSRLAMDLIEVSIGLIGVMIYYRTNYLAVNVRPVSEREKGGGGRRRDLED